MDVLNLNPWMKTYCLNNNNHLLKSIENPSNYKTKSCIKQKYLSSKKDAQLLIYFYNYNSIKKKFSYLK